MGDTYKCFIIKKGETVMPFGWFNMSDDDLTDLLKLSECRCPLPCECFGGNDDEQQREEQQQQAGKQSCRTMPHLPTEF